MSKGWDAVARIGAGLMDREARKRELEEERKYAEELANKQWEREAEKRKLEAELQAQRIEKEKALAERARQGAQIDAGNAQIGKVVGGERFYQKPVEGGLFEIGREEVGPTAAERLRSADSRARTGAIQSSADARRQDAMTEKQRAEARDLEIKALELEAKMREKQQAYNPMAESSGYGSISKEQHAASIEGVYGPQARAFRERAAALQSGGGAPKGAPGSSKDNPAPASAFKSDPPSGTWVLLPSGNVIQVP